MATLEKDTCKTYEEAHLEIYRKLRPGEPPTVDSSETLLQNLFFDARRYDLSSVGRYKFNKKLDMGRRLAGHVLAAPVADPWTGEVIAEAGEKLTRERAQELAARGVNDVYVDVDGTSVRVFANNMIDPKPYLDFDPEEIGLTERVRFTVFKDLLEQYSGCLLYTSRCV